MQRSQLLILPVLQLCYSFSDYTNVEKVPLKAPAQTSSSFNECDQHAIQRHCGKVFDKTFWFTKLKNYVYVVS